MRGIAFISRRSSWSELAAVASSFSFIAARNKIRTKCSVIDANEASRNNADFPYANTRRQPRRRFIMFRTIGGSDGLEASRRLRMG